MRGGGGGLGLAAALGLRAVRLAKLTHQILRGADAQLLFDYPLGRGDLIPGIFQAEDGLGVAAREHAVSHVSLHLGWQLGQAQGVGHGGPIFADPGGNLLLREVKLIH